MRLAWDGQPGLPLVKFPTSYGTPIATYGVSGDKTQVEIRETSGLGESNTSEETTQDAVDSGQASTGIQWESLFRRLNLPFLIGAVITGFLALNSDPWWTVGGLGSSSILSASVSPFYVQINGLGAPTTVPNSDLIGSAARLCLGLTSVALGWQIFFPMSVWRKPVLWLSLSCLAGIFLSFALLLHSTQLFILQTYGVDPQLSGTSIIPGVVLGTDYVAYASPTISSSLALPFFVGLAGFVLLGGSELVQSLQSPRLASYLPEFMAGLSGAFLSPPYQHAWLTTTDESLNPLSQDPDKLTDDELALSFEKLLQVLQPGARVSVILPPWATRLNNRLVRVVSWSGFNLENSQVIFRVPGRPENQLIFRKPATTGQIVPQAPESESEDGVEEDSLDQEISALEDSFSADERGGADLETHSEPEEIEAPPVDEQIEDPIWTQPSLDPLESAMLGSAVKVIERVGEPVSYRELINEVYMDLLDRKVSFESVNQIEVTLLQHAGKELAIIEELDETGASVVRSWWLGEAGMRTKKVLAKGLRAKLSKVRKRVRNMKGALEAHKPVELLSQPSEMADDDSEPEQ